MFVRISRIKYIINIRAHLFIYIFWGLINPLNAELNPICHPLALLGAHHILYVSRIRVNARKMEYIKKTNLCNITLDNKI